MVLYVFKACSFAKKKDIQNNFVIIYLFYIFRPNCTIQVMSEDLFPHAEFQPNLSPVAVNDARQIDTEHHYNSDQINKK